QACLKGDFDKVKHLIEDEGAPINYIKRPFRAFTQISPLLAAGLSSSAEKGRIIQYLQVNKANANLTTRLNKDYRFIMKIDDFTQDTNMEWASKIDLDAGLREKLAEFNAKIDKLCKGIESDSKKLKYMEVVDKVYALKDAIDNKNEFIKTHLGANAYSRKNDQAGIKLLTKMDNLVYFMEKRIF